jgi:hypothetical protein
LRGCIDPRRQFPDLLPQPLDRIHSPTLNIRLVLVNLTDPGRPVRGISSPP